MLILNRDTAFGALVLGIAYLASSAATAADAARGATLYEEQGCSGCHAPKETLVGPQHCGVFGREAGSIPDFAYSDAIRESGLVWDEPTLHEFLTSPFTFVPGTNMGFAGLYDENERNDLIAFLKTERAPDSPACQ